MRTAGKIDEKFPSTQSHTKFRVKSNKCKTRGYYYLTAVTLSHYHEQLKPPQKVSPYK